MDERCRGLALRDNALFAGHSNPKTDLVMKNSFFCHFQPIDGLRVTCG